jgi:hypothetical protein
MNLVYTHTIKKALYSAILSASLSVAGFSKLDAQAPASDNSNLPALIMSFTGQTQGNCGLLTWVMENETISKCFVIERSGDGSKFDSIATVSGENNAHNYTYNYSDEHLMMGSNYYRLRQVDMDGTLKYSLVIGLENTKTPTQVQVFPNPAVAVVNYIVNSPVTGQITVQVFNTAGVVMVAREQQINAGANQQSIAISGLRSGNYFLKIINKEGSTQQVEAFVKL